MHLYAKLCVILPPVLASARFVSVLAVHRKRASVLAHVREVASLFDLCKFEDGCTFGGVHVPCIYSHAR